MALALKINAGKFSRIPHKYSDGLFELIRAMLQLDPNRRPAIEDFDRNRHLQSYLRDSNHILKEYNISTLSATKAKQTAAIQAVMEAREKELSKRESDVTARETSVTEREAALAQREQSLEFKEKELKKLQLKTVKPTTVANVKGGSSEPLFTIFSDPALAEASASTAVHGDTAETVVIMRQKEFLKNQHRLYLKTKDPNARQPLDTIGVKRPPPPPPPINSMRIPLNINIPTRSAKDTDKAYSMQNDKENLPIPVNTIGLSTAAADVNKRQRTESVKNAPEFLSLIKHASAKQGL